jgi:hypothetical protein
MWVVFIQHFTWDWKINSLILQEKVHCITIQNCFVNYQVLIDGSWLSIIRDPLRDHNPDPQNLASTFMQKKKE